jgi:glutamine phosphoribosylpyrophosphate amidotransferase
MCGIFGLLADRSRAIEQSSVDLDIGLTRIRHRGPDGTGKWVSDTGQVALGHVRLSIIDLETGAQPMHSDDGRYTIIYNGEIFNYIELRAELGESHFRTHSDTEVVLRASGGARTASTSYGACLPSQSGILLSNAYFWRATGLALSRFTGQRRPKAFILLPRSRPCCHF